MLWLMCRYDMFGDILEAMAGGIERASVVIICFSQSYKVFLFVFKIGTHF